MNFVLDCSVTMAWCFEDEMSVYTENVLEALRKGRSAKVPPIWRLEVANVLLLSERKKRISRLISNNFKNALTSLPITIDSLANDRIFDTVYELAHELSLTIYDAAYLELALRERIPIATLDTDLSRAAKKIHIEIFHG
jgi:predicted nucleic acid-binding protein